MDARTLVPEFEPLLPCHKPMDARTLVPEFEPLLTCYKPMDEGVRSHMDAVLRHLNAVGGLWWADCTLRNTGLYENAAALRLHWGVTSWGIRQWLWRLPRDHTLTATDAEGMPVDDVQLPPPTEFDPVRWMRAERLRQARVAFAYELAVALHFLPCELVQRIYYEACWAGEQPPRPPRLPLGGAG